MSEWIDTLQEWVTLVGPNRWLQALVIIVASLVLAKLVDWGCSGLISLWARRTKTDFDDRLLGYLHRPVFVSVLAIGLGVATMRLQFAERLEWVTLSALKTITVFVWVGFLIKFVGLILQALSRNRERFQFVQASTLPLLDASSKIVLAGGAVYFVLLSWNIDVTAWLASAGIIGLALSFAAKDSLANLFAGMFILADAPYKVGDYVVLDSGERGKVTVIGMRSTRLLTRDDIEITIPNSVMGNAKITNESGGPHQKERIRIKVGAAYGSDIDRVIEVLMRVASLHDELCTDPAPRVRFRAFGESGLDFELLVWIAEPELRGRLLHEMNCEVYKEFAKEGIEIPYPKRDLYVREFPAGASQPL